MNIHTAPSCSDAQILPATHRSTPLHEAVNKFLGLPNALVREIAYKNDEGGWGEETPAARWIRMRAWVVSKIQASQVAGAES